MPPRIPFREPDWVDRARTEFRNYDEPYYAGGDAARDPEDPNRWLRCTKLGSAAHNIGLRPRQYLTIAKTPCGS